MGFLSGGYQFPGASMAGKFGALISKQLPSLAFPLYKPSPPQRSTVFKLSFHFLPFAPVLSMAQEGLVAKGTEVEEPSPKVQKLDHNGAAKVSPSPIPLLQVKKLSETAVVPSRASHLSAGYDLSSAKEMKIPARGKALVPTDLSIAIPEGTYGRIAPRSGLALKHSIDVGAGVIDADYRGSVGVVLFNHSDADFEVKVGDRIAQLIIQKIMTPEVAEVEEIDSTARGVGGFGSTGA